MHLFDPARLGLEGRGECWIGFFAGSINNLILNYRIFSAFVIQDCFAEHLHLVHFFFSSWTASLFVSAASISLHG